MYLFCNLQNSAVKEKKSVRTASIIATSPICKTIILTRVKYFKLLSEKKLETDKNVFEVVDSLAKDGEKKELKAMGESLQEKLNRQSKENDENHKKLLLKLKAMRNSNAPPQKTQVAPPPTQSPPTKISSSASTKTARPPPPGKPQGKPPGKPPGKPTGKPTGKPQPPSDVPGVDKKLLPPGKVLAKPKSTTAGGGSKTKVVPNPVQPKKPVGVPL